MRILWAAFATASLLTSFPAFAQPASAETSILPIADATIFDTGFFWNNGSIALTPRSCGIIEFQNFKSEGYNSIRLSLNPYALPLFGPTIQVYGYATSEPGITADDCGQGEFIGTWTLPDLTFGEETFFDVTKFIHSTKAKFFRFVLHSDGLDVFCSLDINYGTPPRLVATHHPDFAHPHKGP